MKLTMLRLIVVALSCACAVVVFSGLRAPQASTKQKDFATLYASLALPAPAQTPAEKTVAQAGLQKNIKVLGDLPESQFGIVMNYFAASMGRRCNFCHVVKDGQLVPELDDKPEKNTARQMIKLVLDTNRTLSGLKLDPISCYTCHRGRNSPQSVPTLPLPMPSPPPVGPGGPGAQPAGQPQASPSPRPAGPSVDDVINKYIEAIGGQAAIDKLKSRTAKGTVVQANGNSLQFDVLQSGDMFYFMVTTPQGPFERGFDGQVGWEKTARGVRQIVGGELVTLRASNGLFSTINLKDQFARPPRALRSRLNDKDVFLLDGVTADGKRLRFFFDATTGLLVRRVMATSTMIGIIPEQVDFEDWREVDGVKFPFVARTSGVEVGNPVSTRTFTEIKVNAPVDASKFAMPPVQKP